LRRFCLFWKVISVTISRRSAAGEAAPRRKAALTRRPAALKAASASRCSRVRRHSRSSASWHVARATRTAPRLLLGLLQQQEQQEQQVAVADEAARVRELPIGRRREIARRHPNRSRFDDFGVPGPKIFFACGALVRDSGRATAPAGPNRLPPLGLASPSTTR